MSRAVIVSPDAVRHVQHVVARKFGVPVEAQNSSKRTRDISHARAVAMYLCHELVSGASYSIIGRQFGGKDHSTVVSACRKVAQQAKTDHELRTLLDSLKKDIERKKRP